MNKLLDWLDDRTGYRHLLKEALEEPIPGGARWRYVWGSTLTFTFVLQMITGVLLWTAYSPSTQTAWESVYYIEHEMAWGWLVRGIHHFAAQAMVVLLAIHLMQVIIDGAYRAPREINFWLGLILAQVVLALSLTGYLLPWDQKGYYATQVTTKIMGATPYIGEQIQLLAQGGPEYGHHTLTRFFAMHAGILPGTLILFLALHLYVFRRHGITVPGDVRQPVASFWPDQVLRDAVACLGVLAVVMLLAIFKGAELSAPANPAEAFSAARPEWYFLFLFRFLRFQAVEHFGLAFGAIFVPGAIMGVIAVMPLIAYLRGGHRFNVAFMSLLAVGVVGLTGLAMVEDRMDADHQAALAEATRDGTRTTAHQDSRSRSRDFAGVGPLHGRPAFVREALWGLPSVRRPQWTRPPRPRKAPGLRRLHSSPTHGARPGFFRPTPVVACDPDRFRESFRAGSTSGLRSGNIRFRRHDLLGSRKSLRHERPEELGRHRRDGGVLRLSLRQEGSWTGRNQG